MATLATLPRSSRLERVLLALALVPLGLGGGVLASHALGDAWSGQLWTGAARMGPVETLCFLTIGVVLAAPFAGLRKLGWLGLAVAAAGLWTLIEAHGPAAAARQFDLEGRMGAARMASVTASCLILAGAALAWRMVPQAPRARLFIEAMNGSIVAAVACSTLIGYAADLPAVYEWGGIVPMAPATAACLFATGLALILVAWRENARSGIGPPGWVPIPAIMAGLTLTLTLWAGLRGREEGAFDAQTAEAAAGLARAVNAAIEVERNALERLARDWGQLPEAAPREWASEAAAQIEKSGPQGCVAVETIDTTGRTVWVYPSLGNEALLALDQKTVPERREALQRSRERSDAGPRAAYDAEVSATVDIEGRRRGGFAVFAPVRRGGRFAGWVAGEYLYEPLFRNLIENDLKLADDYRVVAAIGRDAVYSGGGADPAAGARYTLDRSVTVFDRRLTVSLTPADPRRIRDLRSLPDFALAAGLGLTAFLALSVHLARRARTGQRAAEDSNRLLLAENEERRRVDNRLKLSDERLRLALDSTEIGIFEWNVPAGHVFYSAGLWAMFGFDPAAMGSSASAWLSLIPPDDAALFRTRFDAQIAGQASFADLEYRVKNRAGDLRWVYTRSKVVAADGQGRAVRLIGTVQDVTARVETEHQLRRAKTEADATSRAKSEFLASMSHEIRTPMNGIIGMTSLIMDTPLNEEQRDFVNTIRASSEALLTIVNDILDFSKIESGKMEMEHAPFGLALCLEETIDLFAAAAAEKGIELGYCLEADVPSWIEGDVTRLWQIITNLINNAVKFTAAGSIAVEVRRGRPQPGDNLELEFSVRDTGIGIPPERMGRLFKAFSQVDSSTTRRFGGTGLGLAICERLAHLMGGAIRAESEVGVGSSFIFTILTKALPVPEDLDIAPPLPPALARGVVIAVDRYEITRKRLKLLFGQWGARCEAAPDAAAAGTLARELGAPPALLVLEGLADDDGAGHAGLRGMRCPRLILTAFGKTIAPKGDGAHTEMVAKPLKKNAVMQAVARLFSREPAPEPAEAAEADETLAASVPLTVLLVEDNPVNQKVALGLLQRLGYEADLAANGREAVEKAGGGRYDLLLMDLQMPEMDGFEASRQLRSRLGAGRPMIIALTANAMLGDKEKCLAAGMNDYVPKPVRLSEIEAAIRRLFPTPSSPTGPRRG